MIDAIHQSSLNMGLRCGEQFRRRYIEGEIIPPGIALLRGRATHKAAEENHRQKIESHTDLPISDLTDAARDTYVNKAKEQGVYVVKEDVSAKDRLLNDGLNDAIRCTEQYHKDIAPKIQPLAVEQFLGPFEVSIELPLPIAMMVDYLEPNDVIGDLKTAAKKWQKDRIKSEIQPIFYSLGYLLQFGKNPKFRYDITIARRNKEGKPTSTDSDTQEIEATNRDYAALHAKMFAFCEMLRLGSFPPCNTNSWWCSPQYCGYWYTCKYVGNATVKAWI